MSMDKFEVKCAEVESFAKLHTIGGRHNGIHHQPEQGRSDDAGEAARGAYRTRRPARYARRLFLLLGREGSRRGVARQAADEDARSCWHGCGVCLGPARRGRTEGRSGFQRGRAGEVLRVDEENNGIVVHRLAGVP